MEHNAKQIIELYLDYRNNYLTTMTFAEAKGLTLEYAEKLLHVGRFIAHFDHDVQRNKV